MSRKSYVATSALVTISKKKDKISKLSERSNMAQTESQCLGTLHLDITHYTWGL